MNDKVRTINEVDQFIEALPNEIQDITVALREIILHSSPKLIEEFKWFMPNYSYNGLVCYLQTASRHVNLGFHKGNEIQDKDTNKLLQGTGKNMRHIRIKKMADIKPEILTLLIKAAVTLNED